jgi:hypothetical protein
MRFEKILQNCRRSPFCRLLCASHETGLPLVASQNESARLRGSLSVFNQKGYCKLDKRIASPSIRCRIDPLCLLSCSCDPFSASWSGDGGSKGLVKSWPVRLRARSIVRVIAMSRRCDLDSQVFNLMRLTAADLPSTTSESGAWSCARVSAQCQCYRLIIAFCSPRASLSLSLDKACSMEYCIEERSSIFMEGCEIAPA